MKINKEGYEGIEKPFEKEEIVIINTKIGELHLVISPIPLDFSDILEKQIPSPNPKIKGVLKDKKGRYIRDEQTGKPLPEYDTTDKKYIAELKTCQRRQSMCLLIEGLRKDETLEFEAKNEAYEDVREFYDAVYAELLKAGMTIGQQIKIINAINKVSGLDEKEVEEAKDFL